MHDLVFATHAMHQRNASPSEKRRHIVRESRELSNLLDAAFELGDSRRTADLLDDIERQLDNYASEVAVVTIEHLTKRDLPKQLAARRRQLILRVRAILRARIDKASRDAGDWRIDTLPACDCADCATLAAFLSSTKRTIDLPLAKARRRHLHGTIDSLELPVTHVTRRQGSPYVLELRKQPRLFTDAEAEVTRQRALAAKLETFVG